MNTEYSLHMAINFKRPEAMKSLNNNLGSIPGGRKSKLSGTLWLLLLLLLQACGLLTKYKLNS